MPAEKVAVGNVACFKSDIDEYCKASKGHIETTLTHFSGQIYPSTFLFMIFENQDYQCWNYEYVKYVDLCVCYCCTKVGFKAKTIFH